MSRPPSRSILILSLGVGVPARRRTWQQAQALAARGWEVTVIGPRRRGHPSAATIEGIAVLGFPQPFEGSRHAGLIVESLIASAFVAVLLTRTLLRKRIDVVQVVNPPDWPLLLVLPLRLTGTRIVYDMADYAPSLYKGKFSDRGLVLSAMRLLAHRALRVADLVLTSNEVYRRLARRAGQQPRDVMSIYSYPSTLPPIASPRSPGLPRIGYFGVLGHQDGVDLLIEAIAHLRDRGRNGFCVEIVGDGPARRALEIHVRRRKLGALISFRGFLEGAALHTALSQFDIAIIPDPPTCYTHRISMNKVFAYAAHGIATVSTPLRETARLMGDAICYAATPSPHHLATAIEELLHEPARQCYAARIRRTARLRFDWAAESERYASALEALCAAPARTGSADIGSAAATG